MQGSRIPRLTHLQFLVLGLLRDGEQPGRLVRDALARHEPRSRTLYLPPMAGAGTLGGLQLGAHVAGEIDVDGFPSTRLSRPKPSSCRTP